MKKIAAVLALSLAAVGAQAAPVIIDISWSETSNVNALVQYSGTWQVNEGNTDVSKLAETCVQSGASTVCGVGKAWTNRNGLAGDFLFGFDQSGATDTRYANQLIIAPDLSTLTFQRRSQFIDDPDSFFFGGTCGANTAAGLYTAGGGCNVLTAVFTLQAGEYNLTSLSQTVPFGTAVPSGGFSGSASIIPVPAAVWLFASALGLMGWIRRRANAA